MKAAIYRGERTFATGVCDPVAPGPGEVRLAVAYCGVCGTDVHIYHGAMDRRVAPPQIIGHEASAKVAEIGEGVENLAVGDRVAVRPLRFGEPAPFDKGCSHVGKNLKFIGLTATGTDNIDVASAREHGIAVCNIRDYCTGSVAEHVFGVLLMITHRLSGFRQSVAAGEWQKAHDPFLLVHPIRELSAMTLGIVGYGALGQGVARIAKAFGMKVVISARPGAGDVPADRVSFDDVRLRELSEALE